MGTYGWIGTIILISLGVAMVFGTICIREEPRTKEHWWPKLKRKWRHEKAMERMR